MATRYVWEKYDVGYNIVIPTTSYNHLMYSEFEEDKVIYIWFAKEITQRDIDSRYVEFVDPKLVTISVPVGESISKTCSASTYGRYFYYNVCSATDAAPSIPEYMAISSVYYMVSSKLTVQYPYESTNSGGINLSLSGCDQLDYEYTQGTYKYANYVTNSLSSAYPENGYQYSSGSYWFVRVGSDNVDPTAVTIPSEINASRDNLTVSLTASSSKTYGGTIKYLYQYSIDGGSTWTSSGSATTSTSKTISIPTGARQIAIRVRAQDGWGFTSTTYIISGTATVWWNTPPVISGSDTNLGTLVTSATFDYTITDVDTDQVVSVTEKLDGVVKRTFDAVLGATNTLSWTTQEWLEVLNGSHTVTITATDEYNASVTRTITFTKNVTDFSVQFATPLSADAQIEKAVETVVGSFPEGCSITVEACNNGFDASPTWENFTERALAGEKFLFTNTTKTADQWGYNVRITVSRGSATGDIYLTGISGFFE